MGDHPPDPPDKSICLSSILRSFSAPVTEEHAWAIIFQSVLCLESLKGRRDLYLVKELSDLLLTKDGLVDVDSFTKEEDTSRDRMSSQKAGVAELGVVVYAALDYSIADDESRQLSTGLENLIDKMTSADENNSESDEGIGEESDTEKGNLVKEVLDLCRHHLAVPEDAGAHYKAVCRALVAEAMELKHFMSVLRNKSSAMDADLMELDRGDWAGFWTQVMNQLRTGIKLKKVDYSRTPAEFELTPYEMLMDDIRGRNYKLRPAEAKISARVQKDAREVILEFIRSRPPLKPAGERKLSSLEQTQTPVEKLMTDIRGTRARQSLRKTKRPELLSSAQNTPETLKKDKQEEPRRVIDLDESFAKNILNFEESPDNSTDDILSPRSTPDPDTPPPLEKINNIPTFVLEEVEEEAPSTPEEEPRFTTAFPPPPKSKFSDLIGRLHTLDLNLEEVSHIRCTFTKIELEEMDVPRDTRKDYEKGRICFMCAKVRFNLFNWAYPCQFCRRLVCTKCCAKIRLPSDKLRDIPVCSLSNQLEGRVTENKKVTSPISGSISNISSPFSRNSSDRHSLRAHSSSNQDSFTRPRLARAKSMDKSDVALIKSLKMNDRTVEKGKSHDVCHDCKELFTSIIRAQRHAAKLENMKARFSGKSNKNVVAEVFWPEGEYY